MAWRTLSDSAHQERRRRSNYEIAALIVSAAAPERKTRLMYASRLNLDVLNKYLGSLIEYGLLTNDALSKTYRATPKGLRYLKAYQEYVAVRQVFREKERMMRAFLVKFVTETSQSATAVD